MGPGIHGSPHFRWGLWIKKKQVQVLVRRDLSHILAAALALLVLFRERQELYFILCLFDLRQWSALILLIAGLGALCKYAWTWKMRRRLGMAKHFLYLAGLGLVGYGVWRFGAGLFGAVSKVGALQWLILILTLGTIAAAAWEFFGNKLATSHQEVRFVKGIRQLLVELEIFCFKSDPLDAASLDKFLAAFLGIARDVLCGEEDVGADLMLQSGEWLNPAKRSGYPPDSEAVPVALPGFGRDPGAAGLAFHEMKPVYLPDKEWREAWLLNRVNDEEYQALPPQEAWTDAKDPEKEQFHSVLCMPVAGYAADKSRVKLGVLNFTTVARDPFVNRDFAMAECFVGILSQVLTFRKIAEEQRGRASQI